MRSLLHISCLLFFGFCFSETKAQGHFLLDNFSVTEFNGKVSIRLTISAGSACNGIKFYRSNDSINFTQIGSIEGVCGLINSPVFYEHIDDSPIVNKRSYYKVELGIYGFTDILSIEVLDFRVSEVQIRPNPVKAKAQILFSNPFSETHYLEVYSITGKSLARFETSEVYFEIDFSQWGSGLYFISISRQSHLAGFRGKVLVE
jgi:hypothetical protein